MKYYDYVELFLEETCPVTLEANRIITEFFTCDTLSEICRRLVSDYFLLTTDDLTTWDADPEEFCKSCHLKSCHLAVISRLFVPAHWTLLYMTLIFFFP